MTKHKRAWAVRAGPGSGGGGGGGGGVGSLIERIKAPGIKLWAKRLQTQQSAQPSDVRKSKEGCWSVTF